jgi:hypothetical protein
VPSNAVDSVRASLGGAEERARRMASESLQRFAGTQPALSQYIAGKLATSLDEPALALGHMLSLAVFMAFETFVGAPLRAVSADGVAAADAALSADEELRRVDPLDALDSEDIVAIEQPALVAFVNEHVGFTLAEHADSIDVDAVAVVFRAVLVEILSLSHAIPAPPGYPARDAEPMA